jgi:hypothetical protein
MQWKILRKIIKMTNQIKYKLTNHSTYKYELVETRRFLLNAIKSKCLWIKDKYYTFDNKNKILTILEGYCWDGASGPTIDTESTMRASLVHDVLYQMILNDQLSKKYRKKVDKIFYKICVEDGMNKIRAIYYYWALRLFGGFYVKA